MASIVHSGTCTYNREVCVVHIVYARLTSPKERAEGSFKATLKGAFISAEKDITLNFAKWFDGTF